MFTPCCNEVNYKIYLVKIGSKIYGSVFYRTWPTNSCKVVGLFFLPTDISLTKLANISETCSIPNIKGDVSNDVNYRSYIAKNDKTFINVEL